MARVLYLTTDEQQSFFALPATVQEGWEITVEYGTYAESDQRRHIRFGLMRLHSSTLKDFKAKIQSASSPEDIEAMIRNVDLAGVSDDDRAEIFFAIGPAGLTQLIADLLSQAASTNDIDFVAGLAMTRHELLESFATA